MIDALIPALFNLLTLSHLGMLGLGVVMGLTVGILPGLGGIAGLSLILPFTFGMDPSLALAMMVGILAPMHTSDSFPAILMGIPGTASAQATVLDGFPLSKQGEAARALAAAFSASMIGGLIGSLVLTVAVFGAQPIILAMGFGELMMLTIFALSMVGMLTGASPLKGVAAAGVGLLVGTIGGAPATGEFRLHFGTVYLGDGFALVIVGLGLFALPEIVELLRRHGTISESGRLGSGWMEGLRDTIRHRWIVIRCSILGCILGALPGLGGSVADWITYGHVVQSSRDKSRFGKGDIRGVIAPESANNAITGGAMIPTLLFGIPGSGSMAILVGGFIMIGIQPGPSMISSNADLTFTIIWSLAIANVAGAGLCFLIANPVARLTTIPYALIGPVMIVIIFFGAFQATRGWADFFALLGIGIVGIYMKRFGWPRPALLIGFVLSTGLESSFYRVAQVYGFSFLERPIVLVIIALTVLSILVAWRSRPRPDSTKAAEPAPPLVARLPQLVFTGALIAFTLAVIAEALQTSYLGRIFPLTAGLITLAILLMVLRTQAMQRTVGPALQDDEGQDEYARGNLHYLIWLVGFLCLVGLVGFPLGAAAFVIVFTRAKTDAPFWLTAALAIFSTGVLLTLSYFLILDYPNGLIDRFIDLPWWMA
ncbi:tripartite tricarboxylate transporter permease [Roseitranquillus sediminis]|uniref:tripartite tricarboxylate transporter permease n=1 Tax=Roseitranquillus sediminis TaxID=2809051 RepID=UPI001D0C44A1|nr:tripartite tricarboxylate transporter permease [Roseitranquillus sediminis]MBM9595476.1 tripartite tricarboxylate transporter permease [Roseitranquillus sediminis]